jgi:hypothetical protein
LDDDWEAFAPVDVVCPPEVVLVAAGVFAKIKSLESGTGCAPL